MKSSYKKIFTIVIAIFVMMTSLVGCMEDERMDYADDYKENSESISRNPPSNPPVSEPGYPYDEVYEDSFKKPGNEDDVDDIIIEETPGAPKYPQSNPNTIGESTMDRMDNVDPKVRSKITISTDFSQIGALDNKIYNWGSGGPVDKLNRSAGAVQYNDKFKDYNCYFIGQDNKNIYLTFDEGYEFGISDDFLDLLKDKNVKACFFLTYDFAKREPELVKRMINEGHILGNHSKTHKNYGELTPMQVAEDAMFMQNYIKDNFNYEMKYFRCPSGNFNEQTLATLQKLGFKTIFWSFAHKDWITDNQPNPDTSLQKLKKSLCVGNIYLLHAVSETNLKILPEFIDYAISEGYKFSSLDELNISNSKKKSPQ